MQEEVDSTGRLHVHIARHSPVCVAVLVAGGGGGGLPAGGGGGGGDEGPPTTPANRRRSEVGREKTHTP